MFAPETAWLSHSYGGGAFPIPDVGKNPEYGATIFFNLPASYDGKAPVRLSFEDARGVTIRRYDLHPKLKHQKPVPREVRAEMDAMHQHALDLEEPTTVASGMNSFQWDMHYAPAADIPGVRELLTDDFPDSNTGPTIVPGTYAVTLEYGGKKITQPLRVQLDPRLHPATGDLEARLALEMRVHNTLDTFNKAIAAALAAAQHATPAKRAAINRELAAIVQLNIHSSEGDLLHESKLRDHLAFLANELELAFEKPTAAEYATYAELQTAVAAAEARLQAAR